MPEKSKTGFIYSPKYLQHRPSTTHPESPERLRWIVDSLQKNSLWQKLVIISPVPAQVTWLEYIHSPHYIKRVQEACEEGNTMIDTPDVEVSSESFNIALLAAGGVLRAMDAVIKGEIDNAFCALRPPGHHALHDTAMGFCLFNNAAIAAKYVQKQYGLERILIVDWDVHHGNGTQAAFYQDPSVFYFSIHQYPHYPGTGAADERGSGEGWGYTLNIPMSAFSNDEDYRKAFDEQLVPAAEKFKPQLVLVSAGFDGHADDPLSSIQLSESCFGHLTQIVKSIAGQWAEGRIVSVLEGGYHRQGLPLSVAAHLSALIEY